MPFREDLDDLSIVLSDLRAILNFEERAGEGILLFGFADGERIVAPIPQEQRDRLAAKKRELLGLIKEKASVLADDPFSSTLA